MWISLFVARYWPQLWTYGPNILRVGSLGTQNLPYRVESDWRRKLFTNTLMRMSPSKFEDPELWSVARNGHTDKWCCIWRLDLISADIHLSFPCRSEKSAILTKRIDAIIEYLTHEIFRYISRGLYESDKFTFVLLLALKIDMHRGKVSHEEFQTFIKGRSFSQISTMVPLMATVTELWTH